MIIPPTFPQIPSTICCFNCLNQDPYNYNYISSLRSNTTNFRPSWDPPVAYTDLCVDVDQFQGVVRQHITPAVDVVQDQLSTFHQIPITSSYIDWLNWNPYMTIPPAFGQIPPTSGYFNWLNWNPYMIISPTFPQIPSTICCFNWLNRDPYYHDYTSSFRSNTTNFRLF